MGSFYIIGAILIWSSLGIFVKRLDLDLHVIIFYSAFFSLVFTGGLIALSGCGELLPKKKAGMLYLLVLGPLSLINIFTFFYAYRHTTIANAVLTHYIAPVLVAFLAPVFLKEKLTWRVAVAIALATVGLYIMVGADAAMLVNYLERPSEQAAGILSGLFSGFAYAVIVIVFRAFAQSFHPLVLCFSQNLIMSLLLLPFVRVVPTADMGWLILMGVANSTVAPLLYFRGLAAVHANRAAVLGYLEPVGAIVFSMLFLGEFPMARNIAGGVLILLAGYFTLKSE